MIIIDPVIDSDADFLAIGIFILQSLCVIYSNRCFHVDSFCLNQDLFHWQDTEGDHARLWYKQSSKRNAVLCNTWLFLMSQRFAKHFF